MKASKKYRRQQRECQCRAEGVLASSALEVGCVPVRYGIGVMAIGTETPLQRGKMVHYNADIEPRAPKCEEACDCKANVEKP
jgi:hypothetical protein